MLGFFDPSLIGVVGGNILEKFLRSGPVNVILFIQFGRAHSCFGLLGVPLHRPVVIKSRTLMLLVGFAFIKLPQLVSRIRNPVAGGVCG